nr:hypothetical protein [Rhizobium leguminosarum]
MKNVETLPIIIERGRFEPFYHVDTLCISKSKPDPEAEAPGRRRVRAGSLHLHAQHFSIKQHTGQNENPHSQATAGGQATDVHRLHDGKDRAMKLTVLAAAVILTIPFALPAGAQVVIHEDQGPAYSPDYPDDDQVETDFLRRWNSHHDSRSWGSRSANFGPDDAMRLLERRGYRVRDVKDVGERYLIRASRDGDDLLVSVSRRGEIMSVVHDQY